MLLGPLPVEGKETGLGGGGVGSGAAGMKVSANPQGALKLVWPFRIVTTVPRGLCTSTLTKHWVQAAAGREHVFRFEDSSPKATRRSVGLCQQLGK